MFTFPNPLNIMFPGAGGNFQTFDFLSPRVSVNFAGNSASEREVTEDVGSYGSQIGWLNDIVAALAESGAACGEGQPGRARRADNAQGRNEKDR
jgi:hypothetical protein